MTTITEESPSTLLRRLGAWRPRISVELESDQLLVRTAQNRVEVEAALELRTSVFYRELAGTQLAELDIDSFDLVADHLILIDRATGSTVGTYRLLCSDYTESFYSATEFDLSQILALDGVKLELGRACIHQNWRNSSAINLLWKGLVQSFTEVNARFMFGCSSVDASKAENLASVHAWLLSQHMAPEGRRVSPHMAVPSWMWMGGSVAPGPDWERRAERVAPALLKAYLRAGAVVCGEPTWDPVFNTLDYFTLFDSADLQENYGKRFGMTVQA